MAQGRRLAPAPDMEAMRAHAASQLAQLPPSLRQLAPAPAYPIRIGDELRALARKVDRRIEAAG